MEAMNTEKTGNTADQHHRTHEQVETKKPSPAEHMLEICEDSLCILPTAFWSINLWKTPEQWTRRPEEEVVHPFETLA